MDLTLGGYFNSTIAGLFAGLFLQAFRAHPRSRTGSILAGWETGWVGVLFLVGPIVALTISGRPVDGLIRALVLWALFSVSVSGGYFLGAYVREKRDRQEEKAQPEQHEKVHHDSIIAGDGDEAEYVILRRQKGASDDTGGATGATEEGAEPHPDR